MKKILVSDLIGTLIPDSINSLESKYRIGNKILNDEELFHQKEYYETLKNKMFEKLKLYLLDFFSEDNRLFIVTSSQHSHDSLDFTINELITRFYSTFFDYKDKISFFVVCNQDELSRLDKTYNFEFYENYTAYFNTGLQIKFIESKDRIFDCIGKEYGLEKYDVYIIGDDWSIDKDMLLKGMAIGGKSSLIRSDFYDDESIDDILWKTVMREYEITINPQWDEETNEEDYSISNAFKYQKLKYLYSQVQKGEINIQELMTQNMLYELMKMENLLVGRHPECQKIDFESIKSISIYPTFEDYSRRALMKK